MMRRAILSLLTVLVAAQTASAHSYLVKNTNDSGPGSLRDTINKANLAGSNGDYITFHPALSGQTITLLSAPPALTDADTYLDGDLDDDGRPDITLDGQSMDIAGGGDGLHITGAWMIIDGLAIVRCPGSGIYVDGGPDCLIKGCHVGVSAAGTKNRPNGFYQIKLRHADGASVGAPWKRNIISAGPAPAPAAGGGVRVEDTQRAVIGWNYIGVTRDGSTALGTGQIGVYLGVNRDCRDNEIRDCLLAGMQCGVYLDSAQANKVFGCTFGLAADGRTPLAPGLLTGVAVYGLYNLIGGDTVAERNVFTGDSAASTGVVVSQDWSRWNRIEGNYFGTDAGGTRQRDLRCGVSVVAGAGPVTIGGATEAAGNYFASPTGSGVFVTDGGQNSTIQNNRFGVLPVGGDVSGTGPGTMVLSMSPMSPSILDNTFARLDSGIRARGAGATPAIYGNTFRRCGTGVSIEDSAQPKLGNLANASTTDDGGNFFRNSTSFHIVDQTPNHIWAEGNDFGTTVKAEIEAKIIDKLDNPAFGRVDFIPLYGGVLPSGARGGVAALAVTGAAAVPTATGAEITFTLSAPAQVTVEILNLAGRPVALLAQARPTDAGLQRLAWNGQSLTGTGVPAGRYLARIKARDATGAQATALAPMSFGH